MTPFTALVDRWIALAAEGEAFGMNAAALRRCANELGAVVAEWESETLTLDEAAKACGYSKKHLRRLLTVGTVANVGGLNGPRIRRGDLPTNPGELTRRERLGVRKVG